eukprot:jgi/Antlo1/1408/1375
MKKTENSEKSLSTRDYNMSLINKYIIRSRRIEVSEECMPSGEYTAEESLSDECLSYSHSEASSPCSEESSGDDGTLQGLNVYRNRKL